jgi:dolichol-phosphate mannosyltransferase
LSPCVSLIVPLSAHKAIGREDLREYERELDSYPGVSEVEVIIMGGSTDGDGRVGALRSAIEAARGDVLIIVDPRRRYEPEALSSVLNGLNESDADLVIGVPRPEGRGLTVRSMGRRLVGWAGLAALGTSDVFSGLMAIRRKHLECTPTAHQARGSRLALDLLAWPCRSHCDIPVPTAPGDRIGLFPLRLDDVRQLKRVLDQRFGTFSRLVQFCMVGASGMVLDLACYALFQLFLPLAGAGALSIFIALVWNFSLNRRLTFNDARSGSIFRQFATYALGNALGIAVSLSLRLYLPRTFSFFDQHKLAAAVVGIVAATAISFSMSRWVVFIRHTPASRRTKSPKAPSSVPKNAAVS